MLADRWQRHKAMAAAGYGLSAICKLGLLAAGGSSPALAAVISLDRTGKGIRTAPRDALISLSATEEDLEPPSASTARSTRPASSPDR